MTEAASMNWSREFDEPIALPDGGELRTLLDAGRYVDALPRSIHEREEWQAVMEVLLLAVEGRESLKKTTLVEIPSELTMLRISNPVRPGIEMSRMAISGLKLRIASMQLIPSLQHATSLNLCCAPSTFFKPCTTTGQRSAINTLIQRMSGPSALS